MPARVSRIDRIGAAQAARSLPMWRQWALLLAAAALPALILYARALSLPFYSDDLIQVPWFQALPPGGWLSQLSPYAYYRPLAFGLWAAADALGLLAPLPLRLIGLLLHITAAGLAGLLAARLTGRPAAAPLGAALYAAYPFAYQVVPWVSGVFYPLAATLLIGGVVSYLAFRSNGDYRWLAASLAGVGLAPLAHEAGMLGSLLIALAEGYLALTNRQAHRARPWPLIHLALNAAYAVIWLSLRGEAGSDTQITLAPMNALIFSLGLSYPVAWPFAALPDVPALLLALIAAALPAVYLLRQRPQYAGFCLAWFAINAVPAGAVMQPAWLLEAPRFLYLSGAGAALLWAEAILAAWEAPAQQRAISRAGAGLLLILSLLPGMLFAAQGIGWTLRAAYPLSQAAALMESPVLINLPARVQPQQAVLPVFTGGVEVLPARVQPGQIARQAQAYTAGHILSPQPYAYTPFGPPRTAQDILAQAGTDRRLYTAIYTPQRIELVEAGRLLAAPPADQASYLAEFGRSVLLWQADHVLQGDQVRLRLTWQDLQALPGAAIFAHLVDAQGQLVAQADGGALFGLLPLEQWTPGLTLLEFRLFNLPMDAPHPPYTVYIGVWEPASDARLAALDAAGRPYPQNQVPAAVIGQLPPR